MNEVQNFGEVFNFLVQNPLFTVVIKFFKSICLVPTKTAYIVERFGKYSETLALVFML